MAVVPAPPWFCSDAAPDLLFSSVFILSFMRTLMRNLEKPAIRKQSEEILSRFQKARIPRATVVFGSSCQDQRMPASASCQYGKGAIYGAGRGNEGCRRHATHLLQIELNIPRPKAF